MSLRLFSVFLCFTLFAAHCPAYTWTHSATGTSQAEEPLEVIGQGTGFSQWTSEEILFTPGEIYRFSVDIMSPTGDSGCLPCGTDFLHRDFSATPEWTTQSYFFRVPDNSSSGVLQVGEVPDDRRSGILRVGEWESTGTFRFKNVRLEECKCFPKVFEEKDADGKISLRLLSEGESIRDGKYRYRGQLAGEGTNIMIVPSLLWASNSQAPLFNSNRWCFGPADKLDFTFENKTFGPDRLDLNFLMPVLFGPLSDPPLRNAVFSITVNYHTQGECVLQVAKNPALFENNPTWTELGRIDKVGNLSVPIPQEFLDSPTGMTIRLRATRAGSDFQVDAIDFEADIDSSLNNAIGKTYFALPVHSKETVKLNEETEEKEEFLPLGLDDQRNLYITGFSLLSEDQKKVMEEEETPFLPVQKTRLQQPARPGEGPATFRLGLQEYELVEEANLYYRQDYGYNIPGLPIGQIWWSEADWKVAPQRPVPEKSSVEPVKISAAKNDYESFQLVVNGGEHGIKGLTATVGSLRGPDGSEIPASDIQVRYAYYHFVHSPTDRSGAVDYWPDALVPLETPINVEPNRNQPIWITIYVPENATSGLYKGTVQLTMEEDSNKPQSIAVPFTLKVWNFALPVENHVKTAFGINPWLIAQYHNAKTDEERRAVYELYLKNFSEHRISPYTPVPFDGIAVNWKTDENPMRAEIDFSAFEKEMQRVLEKYHFTGFQLGLQGMGWGTFHDRGKGNLAGFEEGSSEYSILFADYVKQMETFLRKNDWLDKAYIYWFDEPERKDYEFVADGFSRIHQAAPDIQKMLTEKPGAAFTKILEEAGAKIDIWCPISNNFNINEAKKRQAEGEKFWWYVCTGPKYPYATLFIDHPATELRVWFWQGWERGIVGFLVWESTYWTSSSAFPDPAAPQNPYLDPMGYVSGYSTPAGTKMNWGNGDGRFVYPPLCAAVPGGNGGEVILKEPVSSIRWEMIREGIEDYEMLWLLRDLFAKNGGCLSADERKEAEDLLIVPESISKSITGFTQDARDILKRREKVAEMIERLVR